VGWGLSVTWWREDPSADIKEKLDLSTKTRTKSAAEPDNTISKLWNK